MHRKETLKIFPESLTKLNAQSLCWHLRVPPPLQLQFACHPRSWPCVITKVLPGAEVSLPGLRITWPKSTLTDLCLGRVHLSSDSSSLWLFFTWDTGGGAGEGLASHL